MHGFVKGDEEGKTSEWVGFGPVGGVEVGEGDGVYLIEVGGLSLFLTGLLCSSHVPETSLTLEVDLLVGGVSLRNARLECFLRLVILLFCQ